MFPVVNDVFNVTNVVEEGDVSESPTHLVGQEHEANVFPHTPLSSVYLTFKISSSTVNHQSTLMTCILGRGREIFSSYVRKILQDFRSNKTFGSYSPKCKRNRKLVRFSYCKSTVTFASDKMWFQMRKSIQKQVFVPYFPLVRQL